MEQELEKFEKIKINLKKEKKKNIFLEKSAILLYISIICSYSGYQYIEYTNLEYKKQLIAQKKYNDNKNSLEKIYQKEKEIFKKLKLLNELKKSEFDIKNKNSLIYNIFLSEHYNAYGEIENIIHKIEVDDLLIIINNSNLSELNIVSDVEIIRDIEFTLRLKLPEKVSKELIKKVDKKIIM